MADDALFDMSMLETLRAVLAELREARPNERSDRSRRYAVTITEMEKVVAYFQVMIAYYPFLEEKND